MMPATMTSAGSAVDSSETARPWMTLVPWPVTRGLGDRLHRAEVRAGVVLGDHDDERRDGEADDGAPEQAASEVKVAPAVVRERASPKPPKTSRFTSAMAPTESTPVAIRPL